MTGFSESSGSVSTWPTAFSTLASAVSRFVLVSNSTKIAPMPSTDCEKTRLTPSRKRTSGSIAATMLASTSSALAPGHVTLTETHSTPKSGKNWVFMRTSPSAPNSTISTITRLAAVRWRVNSAITPRPAEVIAPGP